MDDEHLLSLLELLSDDILSWARAKEKEEVFDQAPGKAALI